MPRPYASGVVPASADEVWALVRDFDGMPAWHPVIKESSLNPGVPATEVGASRRLTLGDGGVVVERLLAVDNADRSYTYEIVESPFPVRRYVSTIRVTPVTASGQAFVEWWAEYDADAAHEEQLDAAFAGGVFGGGIAALHERFGG